MGRSHSGTGHIARSASAIAVSLIAWVISFGAFGPTTRPASATARTVVTPVPSRWVFLGDSVADTLARPLQAEAARRGVSLTLRIRSGCGMITAPSVFADGTVIPWSRDCVATNADHQLQAVRGAQVALWLSSWEAGGGHQFNGVVLKLGTRDGDTAMMREIEAAVERITAGGAKLVFLTYPAPATRSDLTVATPDAVRGARLLNRLFRIVASRHHTNVIVVDLAAIVCPGGPPCPESVEGVRLRPRDGGHFGPDGSAWVAPRLFTAVVHALQHPMDQTPPRRFYRFGNVAP